MNTNACANTVAELTEGRKVADAWEVTPEDVVAYLETLQPENMINLDKIMAVIKDHPQGYENLS